LNSLSPSFLFALGKLPPPSSITLIRSTITYSKYHIPPSLTTSLTLTQIWYHPSLTYSNSKFIPFLLSLLTLTQSWYHPSFPYSLSLTLLFLNLTRSFLVLFLPFLLTVTQYWHHPFLPHLLHSSLESFLPFLLTLTHYNWYHSFLPYLLHSNLVSSLPSLLTLTQIWFLPTFPHLLPLNVGSIPHWFPPFLEVSNGILYFRIFLFIHLSIIININPIKVHLWCMYINHNEQIRKYIYKVSQKKVKNTNLWCLYYDAL